MNTAMTVTTVSRAQGVTEVVARLAQKARPGERLGTRNELREMVGVSVGTFNEAMRVLVSQHVVTVRPGPGGGVFAAESTPMVRLGNAALALESHPQLVEEAIRVRNALDPLVVNEAIDNAGTADVAALEGCRQQMREATRQNDALAFIHANWALHATLCKASPNLLLREIYLNLIELIESHTLSVMPVDEQPISTSLAERLDLHEQLLDAVLRRDRAAASELIRRHSPERP